jgi:ABC-type multidrug transport system fused ATPase/permease subunit
LLDTEPQLTEPGEGIELKPLQGAIEFRDVTFGYDAVRQIVKGVSFRIEPGELVGLVGPSGSGKTTLVNLLVRFYDVNSGEIQVDGVWKRLYGKHGLSLKLPPSRKWKMSSS